MADFHGVFPYLVSPIDPSGRIKTDVLGTLCNDLIKAGVPFEQAFYPGQKHGFRGASSRHFYERATEFFERELLTPGSFALAD